MGLVSEAGFANAAIAAGKPGGLGGPRCAVGTWRRWRRRKVSGSARSTVFWPPCSA